MRTYLFLLFCFNFFLVQGQEQLMMSGNIENKQNDSIPRANILIYSNDKLIKYQVADDEGRFSTTLNEFSYPVTLKITALGYREKEFIITSHEQNEFINKTILLENSIEELNEVILESEAMIQIRKDTIVFQASAFQKVNTVLVEDLLKELPGVEISSNGRISVEGKEIEKILIDGKDVFDTNYRIPSKNIDSRDLSTVEILKNFQENSVLKEFYNSDAVAINLKFKEDRKHKLYGTTNTGFGIPKKYIGKATIFKLSKGLNVFAIGDINNIGNISTDLLTETISGKLSENFEIDRSIGLINSNRLSDIPYLKESNYIRNSSQFGSLNLYQDFEEKGSLRLIGSYANDRLQASETFMEEYHDDNNSSYKQKYSNNIKYKKFVTEAFYQLNHSENFFLEASSYLSLDNPSSEFGLVQNQREFNDDFNLEKFIMLNSLKATFKISKNKGLDIIGYHLIENNPQNYSLRPGIKSNLQTDQSYSNYINSIGFQGSFITQNNDIKFGYNRNRNQLSSRTNAVENPFGYEQFKNDLLLIEDYLFLDKGWRFPLFWKFYTDISLIAGYNFYRISDKIDDTRLTENQLLLNPKISISRSTKDYGKFRLRYTFNQNPVKITDYFKNPILTDRNSFLIGTDQILKSFRQRISLTHSKSIYKEQFFFRTQLSYANQENSIGYKNQLDGVLNYTELAPNQGNKLLMGSLAIDRVLSKINSGIGFDYTYLSRFSKVGFDESKLTTFITEQHRLKVAYGTYFSGFINFKANVEGQLISIESNTIRKNVSNWSSYISANLEFQENLSIDFFVRQIYPSSNEIEGNTTSLTDLEMHYVLKKGKMNLFFGIQNILNQETYSRSFLTATSKLTRQVNLQPTFAYFSFKFRW